jgi:hypothetical protein
MEYPAHAPEPAKLIFDFPRAESAAHRVDGNVHQKKLLVHRNYGFGRRSLRAIRCSRLCSSEIHLAGALIFPGKPPLKSSLAFVFCVGSVVSSTTVIRQTGSIGVRLITFQFVSNKNCDAMV